MLKTPKFWQNTNIFSLALLPLSLIYLTLGKLRSIFAKPYNARAKVICIGNNIVGGSGKTSVVIKVCQLLKHRNVKFCAVTYGPGGSLTGPQLTDSSLSIEFLGDEALMLSQFAPTIIAKDKSLGIKLADKLGYDYIIVDDGLQNPNFTKNLAVCIYNANIKNNGYIFPAGPNRESLKSTIEKSDIIISFGEKLTCKGKISIEAKKIFSPSFKKEEIIAFCSIANPDLFKQALKSNGATIKKFYDFPDHFLYNESDLELIFSKSKKSKTAFVTTFKDYVKLPAKFQKMVKVLEEVVEIKNEDKFLNEILKKKN